MAAQEPLVAVGRVCRDEGAGRICMRGTYANRDIQVGSLLCELAAWLPFTAVPQSSRHTRSA